MVLMANWDFPYAGPDDYLSLQRIATAAYKALDQ